MRLLVEMSTRNTGWGYTRLRGALKNVGYAVGRNTIKRILKERGIEPALRYHVLFAIDLAVGGSR